MMNYLLVFFIASVNLLLGLFVLIRNTKKIPNIIFFLLTLSLSSWSVISFIEDEVSNLNLAKILVNIDFSLALLMSLFFMGFCIYFPTPFFKKKFTPLIYALVGFPVLLLSLFGLVVTEVVKNPATNGLIYEVSAYFWPYTLVTGIYLLVGVYSLLRKMKVSIGSEKTQIKYVSYGLFISGLIVLVTNLLLPRFISTSVAVTRFGIYSFLIFTAITTYAIVRHRLMDIRMVVARSVAYVLLIATLAGFYAGSVLGIQALFFPQAAAGFNLAEGAMRTIIAVIMVFLFQPLRKWITKVTDSIFFKEQYNTEDLLDNIAHTVSSTIILIEMLYKSIDLMVNQMRITRAMIIVFSETGGVLESQSVGYKEAPKLIGKELLSLAHDGVLVADELSEESKHKKMLQKYNVTVAVPLKTENGVEGLLMLGEKQSGDMFSANDLKVFEIIAPEIAVAITNAKSYEKIERFNVTLRQEIKKATHELERKNSQLRELDKAKDEFISMASHQLRTPLTAIKGYLSMLLEGDAGEIKVSQYDFVNEAFSGANRMVGLINDLLNVSRMETGRFFLEPVEVDMEKLITEEYKQLSNHAKEKGLKFELKIKGKIPHIWVDETKIRQVVMNFMDNALYYTTQGTVTVHLSADKKKVTFEVQDTGIGVPKNQQKNLFTKFYRADNARHVRPDGTGLGIYLAKRVMDDHNGELIFHSVEGKGSTFGFKMPIKSELKIKRISAPQPGSHKTTPGIGELAAGVGVPVETLKATQAVGIEHPLADSPDAEELAKTAKEQRESLEAVGEK
jgi:signal transduction histidine kinase